MTRYRMVVRVGLFRRAARKLTDEVNALCDLGYVPLTVIVRRWVVRYVCAALLRRD